MNLLKQVWPGGAGYPLGSEGDRQASEVAERLIAAAVVERIEETAVTDTGEVADAAAYRLTTDFVEELGGTPSPQDN